MHGKYVTSDFIWTFLPRYKGVIPNPMVFIFHILCILGIFSQLVRKNPKCRGKGSLPKSQIKSLVTDILKMCMKKFNAEIFF